MCVPARACICVRGEELFWGGGGGGGVGLCWGLVVYIYGHVYNKCFSVSMHFCIQVYLCLCVFVFGFICAMCIYPCVFGLCFSG